MNDGAQSQIDGWLEEGLRFYSQGDPSRALEAWYRILEVDAGHTLAQQYVAYVRQVYRLEATPTNTTPRQTGETSKSSVAPVPPVPPVPPGAPVAAAPPPLPSAVTRESSGEADVKKLFGYDASSSWSDLAESSFDVKVPPTELTPSRPSPRPPGSPNDRTPPPKMAANPWAVPLRSNKNKTGEFPRTSPSTLSPSSSSPSSEDGTQDPSSPGVVMPDPSAAESTARQTPSALSSTSSGESDGIDVDVSEEAAPAPTAAVLASAAVAVDVTNTATNGRFDPWRGDSIPPVAPPVDPSEWRHRAGAELDIPPPQPAPADADAAAEAVPAPPPMRTPLAGSPFAMPSPDDAEAGAFASHTPPGGAPPFATPAPTSAPLMSSSPFSKSPFADKPPEKSADDVFDLDVEVDEPEAPPVPSWKRSAVDAVPTKSEASPSPSSPPASASASAGPQLRSVGGGRVDVVPGQAQSQAMSQSSPSPSPSPSPLAPPRSDPVRVDDRPARQSVRFGDDDSSPSPSSSSATRSSAGAAASSSFASSKDWPTASDPAPGKVLDPWDEIGGAGGALDLDNRPQSAGTPLDTVLGVATDQQPGGYSTASLDSVTAPAPEDECTALMRGARELFELGDFSGSLELVEKVLRINADHEGARAYMQRNESTLIKMYESKLGNMQKAPKQLMPPDEVIWMNMHHKAGFLLSQVDGSLTYEDLLEVSGMPRFDTMRILHELVTQGIIG